MPPKRKEREGEASKTPRMDHIQADHELFLQAFEKPTQIYRYLRTRNMISPIFLNRTLTYMRQRMSRSHKTRRTFKIDTMLGRQMEKNRNDGSCGALGALGIGGYMTLTFLGFYDKTLDGQCDTVKVETVLLKISHKKRKDSSAAMMQVSIGTNEVYLNPSDVRPPTQVPALSIPSESFKPATGPLAKSYMLLLRVQCPTGGGICTTIDEPSAKRMKTTRLFGSELVVIDKHSRCLLTEGEYQLRLNEIPSSVKASPKKSSKSWENINESEISSKVDYTSIFDSFDCLPTLKFKLCWTQEPSSALVERPAPLPKSVLNENKEINKDNRNNGTINNNLNSIPSLENGVNTVAKPDDKMQVVYQFLYNNNSRQQTEACDDFHCPWCSLNCGVLYSLLKHLKLSHSRFTFTYVPITQGARIDVAINELYDGSYTGSPHDLVAPSGFAFSRTGPVRRTSVTHILVCRPRRSKPSLSEFLELDENEFDSQRPYITGHNRLYHHTITCLPVHPKELDVDSEGENDPLWLQHKTMMMIDEFTDVNEGEKELMKMWNLHVMKYGYDYVGDCQIPLACKMFLEKRGKELLQKNLYKNFVLHMCSLFDFGLIAPEVLYQTIQILQDMIRESTEIKNNLQEAREAQLNYWIKYGVFKQQTLPDQKTLPSTSGKTMMDSPMVRRKMAQGGNRGGYSNTDGHNSQRRKMSTQIANLTNGINDSPPRRRSSGLLGVQAAANLETPQRRRSEASNRACQSEAIQRKRMSLGAKADNKN